MVPPFGSEFAEEIGLEPGDVSEIVGTLLGAGAAAMVVCSFDSGQRLPVLVPLQQSAEATIAELAAAHPNKLILAVPSGSVDRSPGGLTFAGVNFTIIEPGPELSTGALQPDASGASAHIASS
jgi:hypothetical protein